jgi:hypothetical protein
MKTQKENINTLRHIIREGEGGVGDISKEIRVELREILEKKRLGVDTNIRENEGGVWGAIG